MMDAYQNIEFFFEMDLVLWFAVRIKIFYGDLEPSPFCHIYGTVIPSS